MLFLILTIQLAIASQTLQSLISTAQKEIVSNYAIKTLISKSKSNIKSFNDKIPSVFKYISQKFGDQLLIKDSHIDANSIFHVYGVFNFNGIPVVNLPISLHFLEEIIFSETHPLLSKEFIIQPPIAKISDDIIRQMLLEKYKDCTITELKKVYLKIGEALVYVYEAIVEDYPITQKNKISIDASTGEIYRNMVRSLNYQTFVPQNQDMKYAIHSEPDFDKLKQYGIGNWINSNSSVPDNLIIKSDQYTHNLASLTAPITTQYDFNNPISDPSNLNLLTQHVYYTLNVVHDILYNYQFTETNGNYQISKSAKPDPMIVDVSLMIKNDAFFIPAADGVSGMIRLGLDSITQRHFSMDPVVIIHEYIHGVSTRLVGGPSNSECLSLGEGMALGEGISDIIALLMTMDGTETRQTVKYIGQFLYGDTKGYRNYGYSTDMNINPLVFSMNTKNSHERGELFAVTMYEVYWNLVDYYGFTKNILDSTQMKGNVILLKLLIESLKLLTCYGGFLDMRDSIMLADEIFYGGKNYCMLWNGFSKRGLGVNSTLGSDSFIVPDKCKVRVVANPTVVMDNSTTNNEMSVYGPVVLKNAEHGPLTRPINMQSKTTSPMTSTVTSATIKGTKISYLLLLIFKSLIE